MSSQPLTSQTQPPDAVAASQAVSQSGAGQSAQPPPIQPVKGTPIKAGAATHGVTPKDDKIYRIEANREMNDKRWVLLLDFLDTLLPLNSVPNDAIFAQAERILKALTISKGQKEDTLYEPLHDAFKSMLDAANLKYTVKATAYNPESGHDDLKPDLCMYHSTEDDMALITPKNINAAEYRANTVWSRIVALFEIKIDEAAKPFNFDDGSTLVIDSNERHENLGPQARAQIISYAVQAQIRQHRTGVFTAFIYRDWVRFLRWDRNGALVSKAVNYVRHPRPLLEFVYRIAVATPETQGFVPAFKLMTERKDWPAPGVFRPRDIAIFRQHQDEIEEREGGEYSTTQAAIAARWKKRYVEKLQNTTYYPLHKIEFTDSFGPNPKTRTYIVGGHIHASHSPTGRGTKVFPAFDTEEKRLVCLKLYWKTVADTAPSEDDVYAKLYEAGVQNIARPLSGGAVKVDNKEQSTLTEDHWNPGAAKSRPPTKRHLYYMITEDLGRPLEYFERQAVALNCLLDALDAHHAAYNAGVLHRDVSLNNILINLDTGRGMLNDWDLAKYVVDLGNEPSQLDRSGTWMYMSAALLCWPRKPRAVSDELEPFVHIATALALRFCPHDLSEVYRSPDGRWAIDYTANRNNEALASVVFNYFQQHELREGFQVGGERKFTALQRGKLYDPSFDYPDDPLPSLVSSLLRTFGKYYSQIDFSEWRTAYGPPPRRTSPQSALHKSTPPASTLHVLDAIDHETVKDVFKAVLAGTKGKDRGKTKDQFKFLYDLHGIRKGATGSTTKHELDELESEDMPAGGPPPKKSKR